MSCPGFMRRSSATCSEKPVIERRRNMMRYIVFAATEHGGRLAEKIAAVCHDSQVDICVHERVLAHTEQKIGGGIVVRPYKRLADEMAAAFAGYDVLIFIMAAGIAVRSIAPYIVNKLSDPAVLVMDDRGRNIISLLSGHVGGANEVTLFLAEALRSNPVITTATDVHNLLAPDVLAGRLDMVPCPKDSLVIFNSVLLRGARLVYLLDGSIKCSAAYEKRLRENHVPYELLPGGELRQRAEELSAAGDFCVVVSGSMGICNSGGICGGQALYLLPRRLIAGVGCRRDTPVELVLSALRAACGALGWPVERIDCLASTAVKANEQGLLAAADRLRVPAEFFDNRRLSGAIERYGLRESAFVKKNIGVGNVCEAAALCCTKRGRIALPKRKYEKVTVALIWER